ncbi:hypothetical protein [Methylobacterium sp. WL19]|uniref:hypothetical protein n=1 Tax=Methylobacterium sp. WL19 TaxID=2603896 RepID=UPI0011C8189B|nr:hypothetical protein [Methylobacterium sp. WL19]TXN29108.1 hypothetical protein FV220_07470 [Methylobacterium sp. WL19]
MAGTDDYLRTLFGQAAVEEAFLDSLRQAKDVQPSGAAIAPAPLAVLSLMITNQQRAELRELGFSDESIRMMTPAEAHDHLGLTKPSL